MYGKYIGYYCHIAWLVAIEMEKKQMNSIYLKEKAAGFGDYQI